MKNTLKKSSATALCKTRLISLGRYFSSGNLTILALHRVVTQQDWSESLYKPMMVTGEQFESLLDIIRRDYRPVSLSDALEHIRAGRTFRPGTLAVTFDDGYLDVYQQAWPLLKAYDIPATLFITTGVIGSGARYLWWDEVDYFCRDDGPAMPELDDSFSTELRTAARLIAHLPENRTPRIEAAIRATLLRLPVEERNRFIERLRASALADGDRPPLMLSWDNVKEMSGLIEISSHTVSHRPLDELNAEEIREEISLSKARIEQVTGHQCRGLAYPGGAYTSEVVEIARDCGIEYAVTTHFQTIRTSRIF